MRTKNASTAFGFRMTVVAGFAIALCGAAAQAHNTHETGERDETHAARHETDNRHAGPAATDIRPLLRAFRESGDDAHLDAAWASIAPRLDDDDIDADLLVDAAMVAQARHDFELALERVDRALYRRPYLDQAWLLRASIELVRGNTGSALDACRKLRRVAAITAITCRSRVAIARGDDVRTLERMQAVLAHVRADEVGAERLAWSLSVAGDAASTMDPELAVSLYEESLASAESTQVRSALVDVLLRADRLDDAQAALDAGADALPLAVQRMIVAKRRGGGATLAHDIGHADRRFRRWIAQDDWLHAREMARFYLDVLPRPLLAQRLAAINLTLQREPEDLLLAERAGEQ